MVKIKSNRGGKRVGAGRKQNPIPTQKEVVCLSMPAPWGSELRQKAKDKGLSMVALVIEWIKINSSP